MALNHFIKMHEHVAYSQIKEVLCTHKVGDLILLFEELLRINVPEDVMVENSQGYIKANIAQILSFFIVKHWKNQYIDLNDLLFECEECNRWAYFVTRKELVDGRDKVCRACHIKLTQKRRYH